MIAPEPATIPANHAMRGWVNGVLPTPLLLDATWWFDDPTIDFFQEEIEKREEQVVVCLGTPTLLVAGKLPRSNRRLILIDKDRVLTEALQKRGYSDVFMADLRRESPPCFSAGMVIVDPPWYETETQSFLAAGQSMSRKGAEIFLSLPPLGIRPGIEAERERLFSWCRQRGMELVALTPAATRYVCPPFERNVLRSTGSMSAIPNRVGDLARLRVVVGNDATFHPAEKPSLWEEVSFGSTRIRLLVKPAVVPGDIRPIPMGWPEDVFPSCSRRHPERELVDVWTSGNRAFQCYDTVGLSLFLRGSEPKMYRWPAAGCPFGQARRSRTKPHNTFLRFSKQKKRSTLRFDGTMSDWEKILLDRIVDGLTPDPYWDRRLVSWDAGRPLGFSWHLAVFVEPFLSYVLDGSKTVESRSSVNRAEPYRRIAVDDVLLIKSSGGPIVAVAEVKQTSFYELNREQLNVIREKFGPALRVEEDGFWEDRKESCYATIVGLANVRRIAPVACDKRDKRGWVRLRYQPSLSFG